MSTNAARALEPPGLAAADSRRAARTRETGPPTALTVAEQRVAELVCAGHSRSVVADALFVSVNTVGTHLRSIYSKLQVNSRMQLLIALQAHENDIGQWPEILE
jgi:DNA-binding NarL/FixJ family response regulator